MNVKTSNWSLREHFDGIIVSAIIHTDVRLI